ncbi:MAG: NUDIX hydrolase [Candidatus Gracilibacteria bacterium]|nr:NUDIX hydrolase [Candidatus Gracilibacteria bacterium]
MKKVKKVSMIGFYNSQNQILLQERGEYSKFGEEWAFFGGHLEEGESALQAFFREAKEELGIDMNDFDYKYLGEYLFEFPDLLIHRHIYIIKTDLFETDFTVLEGSGAKFFSFEDANKLKFPTNPEGALEIVEDYIFSKKRM